MIEIKPNLPFIFMISSYSLHYLPLALVEGLCIYGFPIIYLDLRGKWWILKKTATKNVIKEALEYLRSNKYELNQKYWIIDFNSHLSFLDSQSTSFQQIGSILINPSTYHYHSKMLSNLSHSDKKTRFNLIFSKNSYLWFKNRKIKKFMKIQSQTNTLNINIEVIEKANLFFKNNETLLLAKIMTRIRDNN
jgi:hypothetical protein